MIDKHYDYFEVPFSVGDLKSQPGENKGSAKIFSFGLMTQMNEEQTLKLFGEIYTGLDPNGVDHENIRNFMNYGKQI